MRAEQIAVEQTAVRLNAALSRYGMVTPTFFRDGAEMQIVYRLSAMELKSWESGRAHMLRAEYTVRIYRKARDPAYPLTIVMDLNRTDNISCGVITVQEDKQTGYEITSFSASLWEEIIYE